jgi:1-acyl-sn-glycerol-3-phosphate acyltransferase
MNPLIIGSYCPRKLYFFAKITLFNSRLKKRILTRLNLVPVYRKIDSEKTWRKI